MPICAYPAGADGLREPVRGEELGTRIQTLKGGYTMSELNIPHSFVANTEAEAAQVNANFQAIKAVVNALDDDNLATDAVTTDKIADGAVTGAKLAAGASNAGLSLELASVAASSLALPAGLHLICGNLALAKSGTGSSIQGDVRLTTSGGTANWYGGTPSFPYYLAAGDLTYGQSAVPATIFGLLHVIAATTVSVGFTNTNGQASVWGQRLTVFGLKA